MELKENLHRPSPEHKKLTIWVNQDELRAVSTFLHAYRSMKVNVAIKDQDDPPGADKHVLKTLETRPAVIMDNRLYIGGIFSASTCVLVDGSFGWYTDQKRSLTMANAFQTRKEALVAAAREAFGIDHKDILIL